MKFLITIVTQCLCKNSSSITNLTKKFEFIYYVVSLTLISSLLHYTISRNHGVKWRENKFLRCIAQKTWNNFYVSKIIVRNVAKKSFCRKFILFKPWIIISGIEVIGNQRGKFVTKSSTLTQTNHINQKINWRCLECDKVESSFHLFECIIWHQQWHALEYEHFSSRLCLHRIKFYVTVKLKSFIVKHKINLVKKSF